VYRVLVLLKGCFELVANLNCEEAEIEPFGLVQYGFCLYLQGIKNGIIFTLNLFATIAFTTIFAHQKRNYV
jgi:hypothetical protein